MAKSVFFKLLLILAILTASLASVSWAGELEDRFVRLRTEEIQVKEKRMEEMGSRIEILQDQLREESRQLQESQERIWQEFSASLEVERRNLQEQIESVDERAQLFEYELNKKRDQDQFRIREKERDIERMMMEMDRMSKELVEDRKNLEIRLEEIRSRPEPPPPPPIQVASLADVDDGARYLENNQIALADMIRKAGAGTAFEQGGSRPEYYIEVRDQLAIEVWRVPDLTRTVTVRPDGRISMPLAGDIQVVGMTLVELRDILTEKLKEFVVDPQVSIAIQNFGGRKFVILGDVSSQGVYRFQEDISLIEALALAGGFSKDARSGKIMIVRGDVRKQPQVKIITADMQNLLRRGMLTENITVRSNDIIFVGQNIIADYNKLISRVIRPTFDTIVDYFVVRDAIRSDRRSEGNSAVV